MENDVVELLDEESETEGKSTKNTRQPSAAIVDLVRLAGMLADHPAFKNAGLGLTEWCVLRMVAESQNLGGGRIAGRLGITPQRSAQIVNELVSAGYVTSTRSGEDGRRRILATTEIGRATAEAVDREIAQLFVCAFPEPSRAAANLGRFIRKLLKADSPPERATEETELSPATEAQDLPPAKRVEAHAG